MTYREWAPRASLRDVVACTWTRPPAPRSASPDNSLLVLPDGCVDVVWRSDGRLFVAGPDRGPQQHAHPPATGFDGVRLLPGRAASVLGVAAHGLRDRQVDLAELWGRDAPRMADALAAASSSDERRARLEALVVERLAAGAELDGLVVTAVDELQRGATVTAVAASTGVSARHLHRRVEHQVGYGPKLLARVLRFRRFLAASRAAADRGRTLGWVAAAVGYSDQAHLVRDCRQLAGAVPSQLVRFVQDDPGPRGAG